MTGRLRRIVLGYPFYQYTAGTANLPAGQVVTFNAVNGPGEILGFGILRYSGTAADYALLKCTIIIDTVTQYDSYLGWLCGSELDMSFHNMFATNDLQTAAISAFSFKFLMAYELTASIAFKNQGVAALNLGIGIHTRQGA